MRSKMKSKTAFKTLFLLLIQSTCISVLADEDIQSTNSSLRVPDDIPEDLNQRQADEQTSTVDRRVGEDHDEAASMNRGLVGSKGRQRCTPMFNLPSLLNNGSAHAHSNLHNKLSFSVDDINVPVSPPSGSFNSAMKLISSLEGQLDPDVEEPEGENVIRFRDNKLHIHGLNLSMLNVHLFKEGDPKFGIGILIRNTTLTGQFSYNGAMTLASVKLSGFYRMSIDNIYLVVSSNLSKFRNESELKKDPRFQLRTNDFKMNISNIGYISIDIFDEKDSTQPTSKYLLRMLQRLLQRTIKRTYYTFESYIRGALESEGRDILDCELTRFGPLLSNDLASSHQNDLARIISSELVRNKLNLVPLPDFEHKQTALGTSALVQFNNGSLAGLENIRLVGETRIKLQDEHLFANTSIGWFDLKPYYSWNLLIGQRIVRGSVSFDIKGIDFDALITKGLTAGTGISVDQLTIRKLESPKMDIGGLPGMNRFTRAMVNFFMGRMKERLASSIQPVLRLQLQRLLNTLV